MASTTLQDVNTVRLVPHPCVLLLGDAPLSERGVWHGLPEAPLLPRGVVSSPAYGCLLSGCDNGPSVSGGCVGLLRCAAGTTPSPYPVPPTHPTPQGFVSSRWTPSVPRCPPPASSPP